MSFQPQPPATLSIRVQTQQRPMYGPHLIFQAYCPEESWWVRRLELSPVSASSWVHHRSWETGELMISSLEVTWEITDQPVAFPSSHEVFLPQLLLILFFVLWAIQFQSNTGKVRTLKWSLHIAKNSVLVPQRETLQLYVICKSCELLLLFLFCFQCDLSSTIFMSLPKKKIP